MKLSLRQSVIFLSLMWIAVQSSLWMLYGINTAGEAQRILREAGLLLQGEPFTSPAFFFYFTEIILVSLSNSLGGSLVPVVIAHLLLNALATTIFFSFTLYRWNNLKLATLATTLLILCLPYQLYNTFIYTESVFFSLLIIHSAYLFSIEKFTPKHLLGITISMVMLCFTRPTGLFVSAATLAFILMKADLKPILKGILFFVCAFTLATVIHFILQTGGGINALTPFVFEHVICDIPQRKTPLPYIEERGTGIFQLIYFIADYPVYFLKQAGLKTLAFFGLHRPWYSPIHNLTQMIFFFAMYAGTLYSAFRKKDPRLIQYTAWMAFLFWTFVVFSCDEWHNRFFLTLTPLLILTGVSALLPDYKSKPDLH